jgi:hypothetical protein
VAPIVLVAWPSGVFAESFQYDCPPGHNRTQGLPNLFCTMAISEAVFKVGFIYDEQLNPPLALRDCFNNSYALPILIIAECLEEIR